MEKAFEAIFTTDTQSMNVQSLTTHAIATGDLTHRLLYKSAITTPPPFCQRRKFTDRYFVCTSVFNEMLNKNRLCQIGIDIRISIAAMWIKFSNISAREPDSTSMWIMLHERLKTFPDP